MIELRSSGGAGERQGIRLGLYQLLPEGQGGQGSAGAGISNGMMEKMTSTICTGGTLIDMQLSAHYIVVWRCDSH